MIITISGTAGSGKSSVAKALSKKLDYKHYSMGDFQREIAKAKGLSIVQLGELEKTDPSIDKMVDDKQINLGKTQDNFVIDSRLSAHFIPNSFKIFLDADINVRAKRITKVREAESYADVQKAIDASIKREKTNQERFIEYYEFDFMNMDNYDLVLDSTGKTVEECVELINAKLQ